MVYLHGMLGRKFGKEWPLKVGSAAEALHAIDVNLKGKLRQYLGENPHKQYKIKIGNFFINDEVEAKGPAGKQDIHIMPVIKGRNSGLGKIFAAVAIFTLIALSGPAGWASSSWLLSGSATWGGVAAMVGASLALGGVAQLLAPKVGYDNASTDSQRKNSFDFGGNIATVLQGNPVPVAYGRVLVNPLPVSVSLIYDDYTAGGIVPPSPDGTEITESNFNTNADSPPNNPVGQTVNTFNNNNTYLQTFDSVGGSKMVTTDTPFIPPINNDEDRTNP